MIDEYIRFAARVRPWHPALSTGHAHIPFCRLDREVDQVGTALVAAGLVDMGPVIGIAATDAYRHAVLTLACARLGFGTVSLLGAMAVQMAALAGVDAMLADDAGLGAGDTRAGVTVDDEWFKAALAAAHQPLPRAPRDPDAIARVQLSSGTTGLPKAVIVSWAQDERRHAMAPGRQGMADRTLSLIGPESGGLVTWAMTWRVMGTVLIAPPDLGELARQLPVLAPSMVIASPVQIAALLAALPTDYVAPLQYTVVTLVGAPAGRRVRDELAVRMRVSVAPSYSSTEAGIVTAGISGQSTDDQDVGWPVPGITIEIVDAAGNALPTGESGLLRIRGDTVASSYRDGPGDVFRDGWFYPGDLGVLCVDGRLRLLGRIDEVINVGGEKVAPEALEELVRPVAGVVDVAAFALPGDAGDQPWLAIVRDGEVDKAAVARALTLPGLGTVRIAWIEAIPRTPMGKPRREELQAAARRL